MNWGFAVLLSFIIYSQHIFGLPPTSSSLTVADDTRHKLLALFDNNSARGVHLIETTASESPTGRSYDSDNHDVDGEQQISLKDSKHPRRFSFHIKSSILTILLIAMWSPWLPMENVLRGIIVVLYLLECASCSTRKYLSNSMSPNALAKYLEEIKQSSPTIHWTMECFHYRSIRQRDGRGDYSITNREKIVTHRAKKSFSVDRWRDDTSTDTLKRAMSLDGSDHNHDKSTASRIFLKATLSKLFVFANPQIQQRYLQEEALFQQMEGRYDQESDFHRTLQIDTFRKKILIVKTGLSDIAFASPFWFWIASCCGLTVPYRVWFAKHCQPIELTVTKQLQA